VLPSDAELIARVLDRDDRHAFAQLVRRHQSSVRALLRRLCCNDSALADDLAQETFLRAYRGLAGYQGGAKLSSWLYRIAYNAFLTQHAKRRETAAEIEPEPDAGAAKRSAMKLDLSRALGALSPPERLAVTLAYAGDATHPEIAEILKVPLGTAKSHVLRARNKLRELLHAWAPEETP
jgi:RNA polymerase sigma factor (sigma-70 family)